MEGSNMVAAKVDARPALMSATVRVPQHVVYRSFVAETVALNLNTGKYHGLNPTAGRMLEVLDRAPTVGDAAATLAKEYDRRREEMAQDVCVLCEQLLERGLVEVDESGRR